MRAAMPKTTSHFDRNAFARPSDIGMPGRLPLQPITRQSCFSQAFAHQQFGLRVRPLVALHAFVHRVVRCGWGRDAYGHDVDAAFARRRGCRAIRRALHRITDYRTRRRADRSIARARGFAPAVCLVYAWCRNVRLRVSRQLRSFADGEAARMPAVRSIHARPLRHLGFRRHESALDAARRRDLAQRSGFRGVQKRQQLLLPARGQALQLPSRVRGARRGQHVRRQPHLPLQVALVQPPGCSAVADHGADMRFFQHALHLRGHHVLDACVARPLDVARGYDIP